MRRAAVACVAFWLVSAFFLGIGAIAANPSAPEAEAGFIGRIGDERAAAGGLAGYVVAADLVEVARRHAEDMQRQQRLHHNPRLGDQVQGWQAVGENVGVGDTVEAIHQKLMESPSHRENILSGRFTEVGVGVVVDGADLWIVQVFRLPRAAEPAPAAEPSSSEPPPAQGDASGTGSGSGGTTSPPASSPTPRPTAGASGASGGATVRAAAANAGPGMPPSTSAPTPPAAAPAPTVVEATAGSGVPTTLGSTAPSTAATDPVGAAGEGGPTSEPTATTDAATVIETDVRTAAGRQVTWLVATAASMLLGVVSALAVHVGGARVRSSRAAAGRRASLLDVWELALAG